MWGLTGGGDDGLRVVTGGEGASFCSGWLAGVREGRARRDGSRLQLLRG